MNENEQTTNETETLTEQSQINESDTQATTDTQQAQTETQANESEQQTQEESQEQTPEWFMKDKYKSVEEQAKAAFELQKKMGKYWGAPKENYNLEELENIDKDDPLIQNLAPSLKDMGISQEGFKSLVDGYQEATKKMMQGYEDKLKEELTTKDAHTYQSVNKWMNENLNPDEVEQVKNNWLLTPEDFHLFNQMRLMAAPSSTVPSSNTEAIKFESSKEVENDKIKYRKEIKEGRRVPDKNHENDLARRFRDAKARELRNKGR